MIRKFQILLLVSPASTSTRRSDAAVLDGGAGVLRSGAEEHAPTRNWAGGVATIADHSMAAWQPSRAGAALAIV